MQPMHCQSGTTWGFEGLGGGRGGVGEKARAGLLRVLLKAVSSCMRDMGSPTVGSAGY